MEVNNAKVRNVTVGLDDLDRLSARMTFQSQLGCCDYGFILTNQTDAQRLVKLMNYTGVYDVKNLNGEIVRTVSYDNDCFPRGFGDPIEDKFIPAFGEELKEVTEAQFEELLKTK